MWYDSMQKERAMSIGASERGPDAVCDVDDDDTLRVVIDANDDSWYEVVARPRTEDQLLDEALAHMGGFQNVPRDGSS